jgi:hypothetical protein
VLAAPDALNARTPMPQAHQMDPGWGIAGVQEQAICMGGSERLNH